MIVFLSDCFHHHQRGVAEELFSLTNGDYRFIETKPLPVARREQGFRSVDCVFLIRAWKSEELFLLAKKLIINADVLIFGGNKEVLELAKTRVDAGKFSILYSERWLKKGIINLLSPNLLTECFYYHHGGWTRKPVYRLCASAYAANDSYLLGEFKDRCYKWAYFTSVPDTIRTEKKDNNRPVSFMWCSRFLNWKHPELPVLLVERLKKKGFELKLDMYGSGVMLSKIETMIEKKGLGNEVSLHGNCSNQVIIDEMRKHDIFLFTSDRNEGWGAVLNEAMANGCVPVASDEIGSVPFLINDGVNGKVFKSKNLDSFEHKVASLLNAPYEIKRLSEEAQITIQSWSPKVAAQRLIQLINCLKDGKDTPFIDGPCSKAHPLRKR